MFKEIEEHYQVFKNDLKLKSLTKINNLFKKIALNLGTNISTLSSLVE
jgi:hypothetical protein